ncbi:hypothetical protein [Nesterenkonia pannonica]|uniref:hypothetical protein n=1 Tax=Nesterenkonia pannonica TaxID=1548602 RepID=UPI00216463CB|nr:hypothetical protein [Nesterenkonia pannonica]
MIVTDAMNMGAIAQGYGVTKPWSMRSPCADLLLMLRPAPRVLTQPLWRRWSRRRFPRRGSSRRLSAWSLWRCGSRSWQ